VSRPDAFGNVVNKTGATPNNDFYRGEQNDPGLSLDCLRDRTTRSPTGSSPAIPRLAASSFPTGLPQALFAPETWDSDI